ncbi:MAG: transglycosylase SLT domain-containing protein [Bacteroidales bacterium]
MRSIATLFSVIILLSTTSLADNDSIKLKLADSLKTKDVMAWVNRLDSLANQHYCFRYDSIITGSFEKDSLITQLPDSVYKARIEKLYSPVDLSYNPEVKRNIEFYMGRSHNLVPRMLALSKYYFPMFEEIMDQHNIPYEMKYLAVIESALNPEAVSRVGATGLWQFMYRTGNFVGLEINSYVDERRDPIRSTHAACEYLNALDSMYNDWVLALAAYNCGPGNVNRAIRRAGGTGNFWDIYNYLPRETRNYVPAFIAVNYLFEYHEQHGFRADTMKLPRATDTIMLREDIHLGQIAECLNVDIKELRFLNPQYKRDLVPAKNKTRHLILPIEIIPDYIAMEDSIHLYKDSIYLNPQKIAYQPAARSTSHYPAASQPAGTKKITYTIKSGDALGLIASWYDVRLSQLKAWNGLYTNRIRAGKQLLIYVPEGKYDYYSKINGMSPSEKQNTPGASADISRQKNETIDPDYEYYTVQQGDNPWDIAKKYPGISASDILHLNNINNASSLRAGQKLKIRKKN